MQAERTPLDDLNELASLVGRQAQSPVPREILPNPDHAYVTPKDVKRAIARRKYVKKMHQRRQAKRKIRLVINIPRLMPRYIPTNDETAICPECGRLYYPFAYTSRRRRHCSQKCTQDAYRKRKKMLKVNSARKRVFDKIAKKNFRPPDRYSALVLVKRVEFPADLNDLKARVIRGLQSGAVQLPTLCFAGGHELPKSAEGVLQAEIHHPIPDREHWNYVWWLCPFHYQKINDPAYDGRYNHLIIDFLDPRG